MVQTFQQNNMDSTISQVNNKEIMDDERRRRQVNIWSGILFQRIFLFSLARLAIYLNKIYQDVGATKTYYEESAINFSLVSLLALILPPLIHAIFLIFEEMLRKPNFRWKDIFTLFINGLLLIPWQIKRHLDGLYFSSQKLCSYRAPNSEEMETISLLNRKAEILEFFEDFYAGFLQIVLQLYIFALTLNNLAEQKSLLNGEIFASAMSIFSMLIAIRRRDDGILNGFLSMVGWACMFASRIAIFALIATILRGWIVLLCLAHALAFTIWIYNIAIESYYEAPNEDDNEGNTRGPRNRFQLWILTFLFFGLPSLVMWPIMFQLKQKNRPMIFLNVIVVENTLLMLFWFFYKASLTDHDKKILIFIIVACVIAIVMLSLYICCKPNLTDEVVLHDMRYTSTDSFGLYYEFCDIVFNLKVSKQFAKELEDQRKKNETEILNQL